MNLCDHPLVGKLTSLGLARGDFVVAGSGPLLAHGLRSSVGDLDIVARGSAWKRAIELADPVPAPSGHGQMVLLFDGGLEIFDRWLPGSAGPDELIDGAEWVQGLPFCPLREVLKWKRTSLRQKDREDILLIQKHLDGEVLDLE
ncbi:hypothetical protein OG413_06390 [Streptomyces sp. NBC_01433]|uniref:hypothetical protein n=1 Tax=Streptomyces sp. NBC_01433 TaxID=2903864 RepID=UPI00225B72C1|nr:hypothetical protein [Streptomyces sp. NBC_01433]MCX4674958.1 hypothetical protein [Streptomyces sp. NBC_01433]